MYIKLFLFTLTLPLTMICMENGRTNFPEVDKDKRRSFEQFQRKQQGKSRDLLKKQLVDQKSGKINLRSSSNSSGSLHNSRGSRLTDSSSGK
jgi:hypothetical protein